ncbi:scavenger receptor cysteine-rich domain-containing protein DMBT1-like [Ascaphus truei]|uniref:scavenger receptor cysteine-rich domain-containing protein DMBT1-like n=1 Tax=Ascaphus truei TaxID=8439 RepID=UPI003F59E2C4
MADYNVSPVVRMRSMWGMVLLVAAAGLLRAAEEINWTPSIIEMYLFFTVEKPPTELRLSDGGRRCEGRVEVYYLASWGTVCDNLWDLNDAQVVCRQLGCGAAVSAPGWAHFGPGNGSIVMNDMSCVGNEPVLWQCPHRGGNCSSCDHNKDAGVICTEPESSTPAPTESSSSPLLSSPPAPVRLSDGISRCAGRVEVLHQGTWGTVCDDLWGMTNAEVVCRQLGCGAAKSAPGDARFGPGSGHILMDDVICAGHETSLWQCPHRSQDCGNCNHHEDASVICTDSVPSPSPPNSYECMYLIVSGQAHYTDSEKYTTNPNVLQGAKPWTCRQPSSVHGL